MKLLLTGASGFVGSSFINKYSKQPDLDILGIGRRPLDSLSYVQHDLRLPLEMPLAYRPDVVIHAAAKASPWGSQRDFYENNVVATQNVIDFCKARQVKKLIYISSSSVFYNDQDQLEITENTPIGPDFVNEYARTKYLGEELVRQYTRNWLILRPRAVFGPGDTVLFPRILEAARKGKLPLIRRDAEPAKGDLIYIDNLLDYMLQAAQREDVQGAFNLTNNEPVVIQNFLLDLFKRLDLLLPHKTVSYKRALLAASVIEKIYKVFGIKSEPPVTRFGVQVFSLSKTFDVSQAIAAMGPPAVSIDEGIRRFIDWHKKQQE